MINSIFDLGVELKRYYAKIKFRHVDAHTGKEDWVSKCNDIVDKLASQAANPKDESSSKTKKTSKKKKVFEK